MKTLLLCLGLLLGSTVLNVLAGNAIAEASRCASSRGRLASIGRSVNAYVELHGEYPSSLATVLSEGDLSPKPLVSPSDRALWNEARNDRINRSSYVYNPGQGKAISESNVVIAYEREAFAISEPRIFARKGRLVLFADGRVEHLKAAEFDQAVRKDERRRRQLGWSDTNLQGTSSPAD